MRNGRHLTIAADLYEGNHVIVQLMFCTVMYTIAVNIGKISSNNKLGHWLPYKFAIPNISFVLEK